MQIKYEVTVVNDPIRGNTFIFSCFAKSEDGRKACSKTQQPFPFEKEQLEFLKQQTATACFLELFKPKDHSVYYCAE